MAYLGLNENTMVKVNNMYIYHPFVSWKPEPEGSNLEHRYAMISYYKCKRINGVKHYKITRKGVFKLNEKKLNTEHHNFMVYLLGHGQKLIAFNEFENGEMR